MNKNKQEENIISVSGLRKTFLDGSQETEVLKGIDFRVKEGEFVAIMGRSGAGKSTFLYQISLLDEPTGGEIIIDGQVSGKMTQKQKTRFRLNKCGYVFQDYSLLPELTAVENVSLPLIMQGIKTRDAKLVSEDILCKMNLKEGLYNLPSQLSGGEQQRVSIARAIAHKPKILFADEPTANLDNESSKIIMNIFQELNKDGQTIIMVTHEKEYAKLARKIVTIDDGKVV